MKALKELAYYLDVSLAYMKMALLSIIEYPSAILGWLLSNPIQFIVGFATIRFVVEEFGSINGWLVRAACISLRSGRDLPCTVHDLFYPGLVSWFLRTGGGI